MAFDDDDKPEEEQTAIQILTNLLREIESEHPDTKVTVTRPLTWRQGEETFTDYEVTLITDESCFDQREATVRRTPEEFEWLVHKLQAAYNEPVADQMPEIAQDEQALTEVSEFFSLLAQDPELKTDKDFHRFLLADEAILDFGRLDAFTCDIKDFDRGELASLPPSYLKVLARSTETSLNGVATRFEFADRLLAKAAGLDEEEAVPATVSEAPVDEDLFDDLATKRADNPAVPLAAIKPRRMVQSSTSDEGVITTTETEVSLLPVTVMAWLSTLELTQYESVFVESGYDDLRVTTSLKSSDLEGLGIDTEHVDNLLRSGMQWQLRAKEADLVDNWARAQHRADEAGFVEVETTTVFEHVSYGDDAKIIKGRKSVVTLRGVAPKREGQPGKSMLDDDEKELRVEGNYLVDQYGNIDFKAGDELVDLTRYDNVKEWDPTPVLNQLYDNRKPEKLVRGNDGDEDALAQTFGRGEVRIEGYLDKLPKSKAKSLLNRYNRRYFKARDGELFYYEDDKADRASGFIRLRGSEIRFKGGNLLEVFDPRKKTSMVLKTSSTTELEDWKMALDEESTTLRRRIIRDERKANELRNTLIFDIGSCSARAGFAEPSGVAWPSVYQPACVGIPKAEDGEYSFGMEALLPAARAHANIRYPLRTATNFSDHMDADLLEAVYGNLFDRLEVDSSERTVIVTEPQYASDRDRARLAEIMFETYNVPSLYMKSQSLLSMYSYNATTGIIVDIGDRLDIIPLDSGYVIEKGVTKMRTGGGRVSEALTRMMSEAGHRFFSPVEHYVGRYVKERLAYVANDYQEALKFEEEGKIEAGHVDVRRFAMPDQTKTFSLTGQRFRCTEGLFQPHLWGKDTPGLHELVHKAIMATAIDMRKTMSRNIFLAGGGTMIPGLADRLEEELRFMLPASSPVKVHGAPYRQHAAIQGASILASLPNFASLCVWNEDWQEGGSDVLRKWQEETLAPDMDYSDDDDDDFVGGGRGAPSGTTGSQRVYVDGGEEDDDDDATDDDGDDDEDGVVDAEGNEVPGQGVEESSDDDYEEDAPDDEHAEDYI
eukprot:TRINITY_DN10703_c0_g1_i1.p1 TRINITY_DN10703_c0_g1~~TRINITY_DN10703_c0_g1_i1.p1  ORF type:complete len:1108 (+),score=353.02 TRINITY_DN10703_c0_g1_i1:158-3325(+)